MIYSRLSQPIHKHDREQTQRKIYHSPQFTAQKRRLVSNYDQTYDYVQSDFTELWVQNGKKVQL